MTETCNVLSKKGLKTVHLNARSVLSNLAEISQVKGFELLSTNFQPSALN